MNHPTMPNRRERRRAERHYRVLMTAIRNAERRTDFTGCTSELAALNRVLATIERDYGPRSVIAGQARIRFAKLRGQLKAQAAAAAEQEAKSFGGLWRRFTAWTQGLVAVLFGAGEPGLTPEEMAKVPERAGHGPRSGLEGEGRE